jgi:hypothetical protein
VTAYPDSGYVLDYWMLNSQNAGSNQTIMVLMDDDYCLQAVFAVDMASYYWLTVTAQDQDFEVEAQVFIDSVYVGVTNEPIYVREGYHYVEVQDPVETWYGYTYFYTFDVGEFFENPVYIEIIGDTVIDALYMHF